MFELTEDMIIGVAKIDEQHGEFVRTINNFMEMGPQAFSKEERQRILDWLGDYAVKHFADEEELQIQCNYPNYETHKTQHQDFIAKLLNMKKKTPAEGATVSFTLDLMRFVTNWIIKHIKSSDVAFGKYYNEKM